MDKTFIENLKLVENQILWLSHWIIHYANNVRSNNDEIKIGGHQASSASIVSIMTALYFGILKPTDRVAVKPHASPVFHAIQYIMGNQTLEKLKNFRNFNGAQSYPSRTKDIDDVDFSTGSVGLGVAMTCFASLIQDYIKSKEWGSELKLGRMVALVGDAELDEGNIYEALQEGWKNDLRNTWWVIDYNRQSLDGIVHEGLFERIEKVFLAFGWEVIEIKYGALQRRAFAEPGGDKLKKWIDNCPNQEYSALTFMGGSNWRKRLMDDLGDQGEVSNLINKHSNKELSLLMENLGGNCVETMFHIFNSVQHNKPTCFLAYTIKGWGTPIAGHKDNHGGLMTVNQFETWQNHMGVEKGKEWDLYPNIKEDNKIKDFLSDVPFFKKGIRNYDDKKLKVPPIELNLTQKISTQISFGKILGELAKKHDSFTKRLVTVSPDVTGTTSLGPWVNRRNLYAKSSISDAFLDNRIPSTAKWIFYPEGQHFELGIAEMNLMIFLGVAGLSHSLFGKRLIPIGTVYDTFISRGLDALNYACYQDSRFILIGTPSGITLATEGGAHQSINTPLIGMSQDGLASFEPAFADELAIILEWSFDYLQRSGKNKIDKTTWLRDKTGGSVYLRLSTNPIEQPRMRSCNIFKEDVIKGAYWMKKPGPNCELVLVYQGVIAPEVLSAAGKIGEYRKDIGVLSVTSADRLNAGWTSAQKARTLGVKSAKSHIETLMEDLPRHCVIITVIDGHPATLGWLGSVYGHSTIALGVEHFGQTGSIKDLYKYFGISESCIINTVSEMTSGGPLPLSFNSQLV